MCRKLTPKNRAEVRTTGGRARPRRQDHPLPPPGILRGPFFFRPAGGDDDGHPRPRGGSCRGPPGEVGQRAEPVLFMGSWSISRDTDASRGPRISASSPRSSAARRGGLEEDHRPGRLRRPLQERPPFGASPSRRETEEREHVGRQAGDRERRGDRRRSGHGANRQVLGAGRRGRPGSRGRRSEAFRHRR